MAVTDSSQTNLAQKRFDEDYITSSEVRHHLNCSRVTLMRARAAGELPNAISVGDQLYIWGRSDIWPHVVQLAAKLNQRKAQHA